MKNRYDGILQFKGTWRDYQERVLSNSEKYLADGKLHIVAAPGSGKTTLGIELIRRLGEPCLILSPQHHHSAAVAGQDHRGISRGGAGAGQPHVPRSQAE